MGGRPQPVRLGLIGHHQRGRVHSGHDLNDALGRLQLAADYIRLYVMSVLLTSNVLNNAFLQFIFYTFTLSLLFHGSRVSPSPLHASRLPPPNPNATASLTLGMFSCMYGLADTDSNGLSEGEFDAANGTV